MRQRTTFFHGPREPVDPALLLLTRSELVGPTIDAAREDRLTIEFEELPLKLAGLLYQHVETLHVRWSAPQLPAPAVGPLLSRLSPGLHVYYTPMEADPSSTDPEDVAARELAAIMGGGKVAKQGARMICVIMRGFFGVDIDCHSMWLSFVTLGRIHPNRRQQTPVSQFYAPVANLSQFSRVIRGVWCENLMDASPLWQANMDRLHDASALDLSYEAVTGTLRITVQWSQAARQVAVTALPRVTRTEVGILAADAAQRTLGPHEIGMAGFVNVLGEGDSPSPVMFSFPSRHRVDTMDGGRGGSFSAGFLETTGLHPTLQLQFAGVGQPPVAAGRDEEGAGDASSCKLFAHLTLPRHVFADKYQLDDALFLASKNLTALNYMSEDVDLEAPDYAVSAWGSVALVELAPPSHPSSSPSQQPTWTAEIPLHLRYLQPADGGYRTVDVPYPEVFWACEVEATATTDGDEIDFSTNPFDRIHLGYDELFDVHTEFWHITPDPRVGAAATGHHDTTDGLLINSIRVPVLDSRKTRWVNSGTSATILLGFAWVLWKLLSVWLRRGYGRTDASKKSTDEATKKTQ